MNIGSSCGCELTFIIKGQDHRGLIEFQASIRDHKGLTHFSHMLNKLTYNVQCKHFV